MRTPLVIALACAALGLAACGGDDEETTTSTATTSTATGASGATGKKEQGRPGRRAASTDAPGDEEAITAAVESVIGGGDPTVACAELVTEAYLRAAYGDAQGCRAAVGEQGGFEVEVESAALDDAGSATAVAVPAGGPNEGEELTVKLVEEDGEWKVDSVRSDAPPGP